MSNEQPEGADSVELLPCPFCGATDGQLVQAFVRATDDFAYWSVECLGCGVEVADDSSQAAADAHWNRRARLSAEKSGEQPAPVAGVNRADLVALLEAELGDSYDCQRVWSAWDVGTMDEGDFSPVNDRVADIADNILAAIQRPPAAPSEVEAMREAAATACAAVANRPVQAPEHGVWERSERATAKGLAATIRALPLPAALASTNAPSERSSIGEVREAVRKAHDVLIELNPNNYSHDDVVEANNATVEAILLLADALGERHGKTDTWWQERRAALETSTDAVTKGVDHE